MRSNIKRGMTLRQRRLHSVRRRYEPSQCNSDRNEDLLSLQNTFRASPGNGRQKFRCGFGSDVCRLCSQEWRPGWTFSSSTPVQPSLCTGKPHSGDGWIESAGGREERVVECQSCTLRQGNFSVIRSLAAHAYTRLPQLLHLYFPTPAPFCSAIGSAPRAIALVFVPLTRPSNQPPPTFSATPNLHNTSFSVITALIHHEYRREGAGRRAKPDERKLSHVFWSSRYHRHSSRRWHSCVYLLARKVWKATTLEHFREKGPFFVVSSPNGVRECHDVLCALVLALFNSLTRSVAFIRCIRS